MRTFTLSEARTALREAIPLLEALRKAQLVMAEHHDDVVSAAATNGGGKSSTEFMEASNAAGSALKTLEDMGIVVRDAGTGLIDFPSQREGEDIFLCWRLGEDDIAWWHPTTSGFSDRRPLE